jgi:hypothetical protein
MSSGSNIAVALAAFAIGAIFGALARWSGFCMRGAIEDALTMPEAPRLRGFVLAMAVALVSVQALVLSGHLDLSQAIVLPGSLFWGGALFGVGMTLTGGCGTRLLVLAAGGNLRSVLSFLVFALVAYTTIRGILAPARTALATASSIALAQRTLPLAAGIVVATAAFVVAGWRRVPARHLVAGALIGLLVPAGYLATAVLGGDEFDPAAVESINVTHAGGDSLVYLLFWTGAKINFGIAFVGGILAGAALVVALQRDFKLVGFDRPVDMLAPTSFIAVPAMVLAAAAAMKWLWRSQR